MSFKTPILCDRRIYDKRGKWRNPQQDYDENIFYYVKEPLTLVPSYVNGREELKESLVITVFGGKPIAKEDTITLENNTEYKVVNLTIRYVESNIFVKDMLKQRIESCDLVLE